MKKIYLIILTVWSLALPGLVLAQAWDVPIINLPNVSRFTTIPEVISAVISILLLLAAIVTIIYLIFSGYKYITAGGNPEQAAQAKAGILAAIVGLIIIFAAWAIASFVFNRLSGIIPQVNTNQTVLGNWQ